MGRLYDSVDCGDLVGEGVRDMKRGVWILVVVAVAGVVTGLLVFRRTELHDRMQLEAAYERLLVASAAGDAEALREALASSVYARLYNEAVSRFRALRPEMVRRVTENTPDMAQYEFFGVLVDGNRAILAYRSVSEKAFIPGALLLRSFIRERGAWRVERQDFLPAGEWLPDVHFRETVRQPSYPRELWLGRPLPDAVPLVPVPEVPAELSLRSRGYETTVRINGREALRIRDGEGRSLLHGGLKAGENTIRIDVSPVESETVLPEVRVIVNRFDEAGRPERVFQYAPIGEEPTSYDSLIRVQP